MRETLAGNRWRDALFALEGDVKQPVGSAKARCVRPRAGLIKADADKEKSA
jgi:hypothetical protein